MWIVRWFLIAVVVITISIFIGKNIESETEQQITINYIFGETSPLPKLMVMFFAFIAGFLTWFIISLINFLKMRSELSAKDKLINNLKQELNSYRSQSLNLNEDIEKTILFDPGAAKKKPSPEKPQEPPEQE
jgi:uncharacterized membrane protein YciS (DUF1049 family)